MGWAEILVAAEAGIGILGSLGILVSGRTVTRKIGQRIGVWLKARLSDRWEDRFRTTIKDLADGIVEELR